MTPDGALTTALFQWGLTTGYGNAANTMESPSSGTSAISVTAALAGLTPNTTYHYRIVATNSVGTTNGNDGTFTTSTAGTPPSVTTGGASGVGTTTATLTGTVTPNGALATASFQWGLTTSYGNAVNTSESPGSGTSVVNVTAALAGLTPNTTYHYRLVAGNSVGTTNGSDQTFVTPTTGSAPSVTTGTASGVGTTTATLNGTATPNGTSTTASFQWGPTAAYGNQTSAQSIGSGTSAVSVTSSLTGLTPNTTYHCRIVATNSVGTTNASDQTFVTTTSGSAPSVTTGSASGVGTTTATLNGTATPNGASTTASFQWGPATAYGNQTSAQSIGSGTSAVNVTTDLSGLASNTMYHYRIVATNSVGTITGADVVFTTASAAGPTLSSITPTTVVGGLFTLTANGSGFDASAAVVEAYQPNGSFLGNGTVTSRTTSQIVTTQSMAGAAPGSYTIKVKNPDGQRSGGVALVLTDQVSISPSSAAAGTSFSYTGHGFTGGVGATSHLKRPDGTEFSTLQVPTASDGSFSTTIDSTGFAAGTYEVWAIDNNTGITSSHVTFVVH